MSFNSNEGLSMEVDDIDALERLLFINTHLVIIVEVVNGKQKAKRKFINSISMRDLLNLEFKYGDEKAHHELILCFISEDGKYAVQARNNHTKHHPQFTTIACAFEDEKALAALSLYDRFFNEQYENMGALEMAEVAFSEGKSGQTDGGRGGGGGVITKWMASYLESTRKLPEDNQELINLAGKGVFDSFDMLQSAIFDPNIDAIVVEISGNKLKHALKLNMFLALSFATESQGLNLAPDKAVVFLSPDGKAAVCTRDNYRKYHSEVKSLAFESNSAMNMKVLSYWDRTYNTRHSHQHRENSVRRLTKSKTGEDRPKSASSLSKSFKLARSASFSSIRKGVPSPLRMSSAELNDYLMNHAIPSRFRRKSKLPRCNHGYQFQESTASEEYESFVQQVREANRANYWTDLHENENQNKNKNEHFQSNFLPKVKKNISFVEYKSESLEEDEEVAQLEREVQQLRNEMSSLGSTLHRLRSFHKYDGDTQQEGEEVALGDDDTAFTAETYVHSNKQHNHRLDNSSPPIKGSQKKSNNGEGQVEYFEEQEEEEGVAVFDVSKGRETLEENIVKNKPSPSPNLSAGKKMGKMLLAAHKRGELEKKVSELQASNSKGSNGLSVDVFDGIDDSVSVSSSTFNPSPSSNLPSPSFVSSSPPLSPGSANGRTHSFMRGKQFPLARRASTGTVKTSHTSSPLPGGSPRSLPPPIHEVNHRWSPSSNPSPARSLSSGVGGGPHPPSGRRSSQSQPRGFSNTGVTTPKVRGGGGSRGSSSSRPTSGGVMTSSNTTRRASSPPSMHSRQSPARSQAPSTRGAMSSKLTKDFHNPHSGSSTVGSSSNSSPVSKYKQKLSTQAGSPTQHNQELIEKRYGSTPSPARRSSPSTSRMKERTSNRSTGGSSSSRMSSSSGYGSTTASRRHSNNNDSSGGQTSSRVSSSTPRSTAHTPSTSSAGVHGRVSVSTPRSSTSSRGASAVRGGSESRGMAKNVSPPSSSPTSSSSPSSPASRGGSNRLKVRSTPSPRKPPIELDETF